MPKRTKIITIVCLVVAFMLIVGTTFGFILTNINNNPNEKSIDVTSKYISVTYNDGNATMNFDGDYMFPGDTATKEFEVENTGTVDINYSIFIEDVINEFSRTQDLRYTLYINNEEIKEAAINTNKKQYLLFDQELLVGETDKIKFVFKYAETDEIQNEDKNKSISFKFNIDTKEKQTAEATDGIVHISNNPSINNYRIYGNSIQDGTPSTDNPVEIQSVGELNLPFEYQEVEYIESTGTQYIKTGKFQNAVYGYEVEFESTGIVKSFDAYNLDGIFGVNNSGTDTKIWFGYNTETGMGYNSATLHGKSNTLSTVSKVTLDDYYKKHTIKVYDYKVYYDGEYIQDIEKQTSTIASVELSLFKAEAFYSATKMYSVKLYNKYGVLIQHLKPCYRKSDGVIGMYDLVSNKFYTNSGTGTFLKGKNVSYNDLKYQIPISINGKNIFDYNSILTNHPNTVSLVEFNGKTCISWLNDTNTTYQKFLNGKFEPKTYYYFSGNVASSNTNYDAYIRVHYTDGTFDNIFLSKYLSTSNEFGELKVKIGNSNKTISHLSGSHNAAQRIYLDINSIQIEKGSIQTDYEEYFEEKALIELDEPLRKIGDYVDYIDFERQVVVRNVKVVDDTGTLSLEDSLRGLDTPVTEPIKLPTILTHENINNIYVNTSVAPSNLIVEYYNN